MKTQHIFLIAFPFFAACSESTPNNTAANLAISIPENICEVSPNTLGAKFLLAKTSEGKDESFKLSLWRYGKDVLHHYDNSNIAIKWNTTPNFGLVQQRYFDDYDRGVSYEPTEPDQEATEIVWQQKRNVISNSELALLAKEDVIKTNCEELQVLKGIKNNTTRTVVWSARLELPLLIKDESENLQSSWTLQTLADNAQTIEHEFAEREAYQSTDFADIGDSESDPFFRKLINLGFIEHGSSGMYDSAGNDIGEHHH